MGKSSRPAERAKKDLDELVRIRDEALQNPVGPNRPASTMQASKEATAAVEERKVELRTLMQPHQAARAAPEDGTPTLLFIRRGNSTGKSDQSAKFSTEQSLKAIEELNSRKSAKASRFEVALVNLHQLAKAQLLSTT